jgi:parvulin-like peptidyl-prolyl isomerase
VLLLQVQAYYDDNIALYSTKERRKISHILFAKTSATTEEQALANAQTAKLRLAQESFADLAAELSDDTVTANSACLISRPNSSDTTCKLSEFSKLTSVSTSPNS